MKDLNPGIREWVRRLNEAGFRTCDSGDGETHDHACDREWGYVTAIVAEADQLVAEVRRLVALIRSWGVPIAPMTMDGPTTGAVYVQASYSPRPLDGIAFVDVQGCHDRMLDAEGWR
jgi:hypothetical protein